MFARVAGLTMTAPIYGTKAVPLQVRGCWRPAITLLIVPVAVAGVGRPFNGLPAYLVLLGSEAAIGACLGLGVLILIHGMTLAGELVGGRAG